MIYSRKGIHCIYFKEVKLPDKLLWVFVQHWWILYLSRKWNTRLPLQSENNLKNSYWFFALAEIYSNVELFAAFCWCCCRSRCHCCCLLLLLSLLMLFFLPFKPSENNSSKMFYSPSQTSKRKQNCSTIPQTRSPYSPLSLSPPLSLTHTHTHLHKVSLSTSPKAAKWGHSISTFVRENTRCSTFILLMSTLNGSKGLVLAQCFEVRGSDPWR